METLLIAVIIGIGLALIALTVGMCIVQRVNAANEANRMGVAE